MQGGPTVIRIPVPILACALLGACGQSGGDAARQAAGQADKTADLATAPPPAFAVCGSCHAVSPGRQGAGPNLAGVWGRKAGSLPDYPYSDALKSSGIVWNAQTLDIWLTAPMKMVPGTKMVIGVPDAEGRKAVIRYLQTLK
jgi:cytochrome c